MMRRANRPHKEPLFVELDRCRKMNWNLTVSLLDLDTVRGVLRRRSQSDRSQSDSIDVEKVSSSNDGSSSAARELSGSALGRSASQRSTLSCSSTSSAARRTGVHAHAHT